MGKNGKSGSAGNGSNGFLASLPYLSPDEIASLSSKGITTARAVMEADKSVLSSLLSAKTAKRLLSDASQEVFRQSLAGAQEESPSLTLCPACGALVAKDAAGCSICGAEFEEGQEEAPEPSPATPVAPEAKPSLMICPSCGVFISDSAKRCDACGAEFDEEEPAEDAGMPPGETIAGISGGGAAPPDADKVNPDGFWYREEAGLMLCPECGSFISEDAKRCQICGVEFDEGEEAAVPGEPTEKPAGDAPDGYWYKDDRALALCPKCGSWALSGVEKCAKCGTEMPKPEARAPAVPETGQAPAEDHIHGDRDGYWYRKQSGILLCPACGAFISDGAKSCGTCGAEFEEGEEESVAEPGTAAPKADSPDGFWYRDASALTICRKCGSFVLEGSAKCNKCGGDMEHGDALDMRMCPRCGAFMEASVPACPVCGADTAKAEVEHVRTGEEGFIEVGAEGAGQAIDLDDSAKAQFEDLLRRESQLSAEMEREDAPAPPARPREERPAEDGDVPAEALDLFKLTVADAKGRDIPSADADDELARALDEASADLPPAPGETSEALEARTAEDLEAAFEEELRRALRASKEREAVAESELRKALGESAGERESPLAPSDAGLPSSDSPEKDASEREGESRGLSDEEQAILSALEDAPQKPGRDDGLSFFEDGAVGQDAPEDVDEFAIELPEEIAGRPESEDDFIIHAPEEAASPETLSEGSQLCPVCGRRNAAEAIRCSDCGEALAEGIFAEPRKDRQGRGVTRGFVERWQTVAGSKEKGLADLLCQYDELLEIDPTLVRAWESKADVLARMGEVEEACKCVERVVELEPHRETELKSRIAEILSSRAADPAEGLTPEGTGRLLKLYQDLAAADPSNGKIWQTIGEIHAKRGEDAEASLAYQRAIELALETGADDRERALDAIGAPRIVGEPEEAPGPAPALRDAGEPARTTPPRKTPGGMVNGLVEPRGRTNGLVNGTGRPGLVNGIGRESLVNGTGRSGLVNGTGRTNGLTLKTPGARAGRTNGLVRMGVHLDGLVNGTGRTNGLVNGTGRTNGLVNGTGLTNGRGRTNGLVNGLGRTNGLTNGRGRTNGLVNGTGRAGLVNGTGRTNGLREGRTNGLTNGRGRVNGLLRNLRSGVASPDGLVNGIGTLVPGDGLVNGLGATTAHGFVNGDGMVNGTGRLSRPRLAAATGPNWTVRAIGIAAIVLVLLMAPLIATLLYEPGAQPAISFAADGDLREWSSVPVLSDAGASDAGAPPLDILFVQSASVDGLTFIRVRMDGDLRDIAPERGLNRLVAFADTDWDASTGYSLDGFGADAAVEVRAWPDGVSVQTYSFPANAGSDWNLRSAIQGGGAAVNGRDAELSLDAGESSVPPRILIATQDSLGRGQLFSAPVSPGMDGALLSQSWLRAPVTSDASSPLLSVEISPLGESATIGSLAFELLGDARAVSSLAVAVDGALSSSVPALVRSGQSVTVTFSPPLAVNGTQGALVNLSASIAPSPGMAFGARLLSAQPVNGTAQVSGFGGASYWVSPPQSPAVDGAFGEWSSPLADPADDVSNGGQSAVLNANADLLAFQPGTGANASFFVSVAGLALGGSDLPTLVWLPNGTTPPQPAPADSDRDGIPDFRDAYPGDFDNDGVPDSESFVVISGTSYRDADSDGVPDSPAVGPGGLTDLWLENPMTGARVFIGPAPHVAADGSDAIEVYIDADMDASTGHDAEGLAGAEALVVIEGRHGRASASNVYAYDETATGMPWVPVGEPAVASLGPSLEASFPWSSLGLSPDTQFAAVAFVRDWSGAEDWSGAATPMSSTLPQSTKSPSGMSPLAPPDASPSAGQQTKTLHLHAGNAMNTFIGTAETSVNIAKNTQYAWTQAPAFAGAFSITAAPTVWLYIAPGGSQLPTVAVTLSHQGGTIGAFTVANVAVAGWYSFPIPATVPYAVPAGNSITATVRVTGQGTASARVYFDSAARDSRIDMPTDTYVDVTGVATYDALGTMTSYFNPGDSVEVRVTASDPFGVQDIAQVRYDLKDPSGAVISTIVMSTAYATDPANFWRTWTHSFPIPALAVEGQYTVEATAVETNGVTDAGSTSYVIPKERYVMVYPDSTFQAASPGTASHAFTVENAGNLADVYSLAAGASSAGWRTDLYIGATLAAYDTEGDGVWNWVNPATASGGMPVVSLLSRQSTTVTLVKTVPSGIQGVVDDTVLTARSTIDTLVFEGATATTVVPAPSVTKELYLHAGASMTTVPGTVPATLPLAIGGSSSWTQTPAFAGLFQLAGTANVVLYIVPYPQGSKRPDVTVQLSYGATLVGQRTINDIPAAGAYTFPIVSSASLPAGTALTLTVTTLERPVDIQYDGPAVASRVELSTTTYVSVSSVKTYLGGVLATEFEAGDAVEIRATVTDPLGAQDIPSATVTLTDPDGAVLVNAGAMTALSTDPANFYKVFTLTHTLSADASVGFYAVSSTGSETNGVTHTLAVASAFKVPGGVDVSPNNTANALPGTVVSYGHTVTNTGKGSDTYDLTVSSTQGWSVSIYDGATLMATDSNGDGTWETVNAAYDTDGDGLPDTGRLLAGGTFGVTVQVTVPLGATANDTTTITATSSRFSEVSDGATDMTVIPEYELLAASLLALTIVAASGWFGRRRR